MLILLFFLSFSIFYIIYKQKNWLFYDLPTHQSKKINNKKTKTSLGLIFFLLLIFYQILIFFTINDYEIILSNELVYILLFVFCLLLGVIDDTICINNYIKLFLIVITSLVLTIELLAHINIFQIIVLTIIISGIMISINLIDGSNGFLCLYNLFFIINFYIIIFFNPDIALNDFHISLIGSFLILNIAFIIFNLTGKMFIGNSGSMLSSVVIAYIVLTLLHQKNFYQVIIMVSYPLVDIGFSFLKKIKNRISLFDKDFYFFFLIPIKNGNKKHSYVFIMFLCYNIFNSITLIGAQYLGAYYGIIISLTISVYLIYRYQKNNID